MRMLRPAAAVAILILPAAPALADAVTYTGTLGKSAIVVELTSPADDPDVAFAGRYFYRGQGIDIPLDAVQVRPGVVDLSEEAPCTAALCEDAKTGETTSTPPLAANWHLKAKDADHLTGTWTDAHDKTLPIVLKRAGTRPFFFDSDTVDIAEFATPQQMVYGGPFSAEDTPYDFLRMQTKLQLGKPTQWGNVAFRYVADPRTKFQFPRVTALDGNDMGPLNAALEQRHWDMNYGAFECAAQAYASLGWTDIGDDAPASMGGYEDEQVEVTFLSPTIMSWTEAGSIFCGGAHPDNHQNFNNLDARTGAPLDLSRIFKGWHVEDTDLDTAREDIANYVWQPDQALADFVRKHRVPSGDADLENECGYDDLIASNLAISFKMPDHVLFALGALPNAIVACGYDLYEAPIGDLKDLLAPTAAEYFPELK